MIFKARACLLFTPSAEFNFDKAACPSLRQGLDRVQKCGPVFAGVPEALLWPDRGAECAKEVFLVWGVEALTSALSSSSFAPHFESDNHDFRRPSFRMPKISISRALKKPLNSVVARWSWTLKDAGVAIMDVEELRSIELQSAGSPAQA